nr:PQQ-dependent sugar dehydrogenase [Solirubrobacterales bacterium]
DHDDRGDGDEEPRLARADGGPEVETVATGLEVPWEIAFLPGGRALIAERGGSVRVLGADGALREQPAGRIAVQATGEAGLLGMAVDPQFEDNGFVYAYRTAAAGNEVLRLRLADGRLEEDVTLVDGIESAPIHDGGRLRIGPDEQLYVTTGDAGQPELAQRDGLNGKILRLAPAAYRGDGGEPEVVSTGHRNVQGLAWQPDSDRLFATEHGATGNDELNLIRRGANYGWPEVQGRDHGRFRAPVAVYAESIAPSGATFVTLPGSAWTGDVLFGALVGEQIRHVELDGASVRSQEALFAGRYGRIRTVVEGPDGALYALTNNTDGRGSPRDGDDRVLRIVPPAG